jgi:hypothetical protein
VELLRKGQQAGFITEDELLRAVPEVEEDITGLEVIYDELSRRGIRVEEPVASLIEIRTPRGHGERIGATEGEAEDGLGGKYRGH